MSDFTPNTSDITAAEFVDRQAIVDHTHRYCWALDQKDWHLLDSVFVADATADLRSASLLVGRDAIRHRISTAIDALDATQHTVTNHQVVIDGDRATARTYLHSQHIRRAVEGSPLFVIAGRYEDELSRTSDGWRITFRRLVEVWTDGNIDVVRPRR